MIALAGVLLLIVVVFSVAVVAGNPTVFDLSIFGAHIPVTAGGVYLNGAGAMLVLLLAAMLMRRGIKRGLARRRKVKQLSTAAARSTRADSTATAQAPHRVTPGPSSSAWAAQKTATPHPSAAATPQSEPSPQFGDDVHPSTSIAERQALLDEAEELTGDSSDR
jgi:hypothetical protein